jgi:hypothetical protein
MSQKKIKELVNDANVTSKHFQEEISESVYDSFQREEQKEEKDKPSIFVKIIK